MRRRNGGREDGKERKSEKNHRVMSLKSKDRFFFFLLEFLKIILAPPECPNYKEEGGGVT